MPKDLATHDGVHFRFPATGKLQEWLIAGDAVHVPSALTCNNMEAVHAAAIGGLGIAYMPDFLAQEAIKVGTLRAVLGGYHVDPGQFSIVWPSSRHLSTRLRAFADFLCEKLFANT